MAVAVGVGALTGFDVAATGAARLASVCLQAVKGNVLAHIEAPKATDSTRFLLIISNSFSRDIESMSAQSPDKCWVGNLLYLRWRGMLCDTLNIGLVLHLWRVLEDVPVCLREIGYR